MTQKTNKFDQLVDDLCEGHLSILHIKIALKDYYAENPNIPQEIKELIVGKGDQLGLIDRSFQQITQTIGAAELIVRRLKDSDPNL